MKLLAVIRLSNETDATTSPERQRELIERYATTYDHEIVGWAEDLDVSGAVSVFVRPKLGPWLEMPDRYKGIIVAKLDRLSRSVIDFGALLAWAKSHDLAIMSVSEQLDFSTATGSMFANILMAFAQYERETISQRVKDAYAYLRKSGKYAGGQVPFGLRPVKLDGRGIGFEHDPLYAPVARSMAESLLAGDSCNRIARKLNDDGVPTSRNLVRMRGKKAVQPSLWTGHTVAKILRSQALLGEITDNGLTVQRCEPIIDHETWDQVQAKLSAAPKQGPRVNSSPLLGVAFCALCDSPMYVCRTMTDGKVYRYYSCKNAATCKARRVNADALEAFTRDAFLRSPLAQAYAYDMIKTPGGDNAAARATILENIGRLYAQTTDDRMHGRATDANEAKLAAMQADLAELIKSQSQPQEVLLRSTGKRYGEQWAEQDEHGRNVLMRSAGFRVSAERGERGKVVATVTAGPVVERLDAT